MSDGRPNLFIVGAPKSGTTAMNSYLAQHPSIYVPPGKDLRFFGQDLTMISRLSEEQFLARYDAMAGQQYGLDSSVYSLLSESAATEIMTFSPEAKIIIMLRNPVEMLHAHHAQLLFNGLGEDEDLSDFSEALAAESDRLSGQRVPPKTRVREALYYRRLGHYEPQARRFFDQFGRARVHLILFDDFKSDAEEVTRQLFDFLDLDRGVPLKTAVVNPNTKTRFTSVRGLLRRTPAWVKGLLPLSLRSKVSSGVRALNTKVTIREPMATGVRDELVIYFQSKQRNLERLVGRDLSGWYQ